jgi:hypothetical protein
MAPNPAWTNGVRGGRSRRQALSTANLADWHRINSAITIRVLDFASADNSARSIRDRKQERRRAAVQDGYPAAAGGAR